MTEDIYRQLQQHFDQFPVGFPVTESGVEIKILKHIFTPEEAKIAMKMNMDFKDLETHQAEMSDLGYSKEDLEKKFREMASKGGIHFKYVDGKKVYAAAPLIIGMYEYQVERATPEFFQNMAAYADEGFGLELFGTKISQFRTVPVEQSLTPEHQIPTYEQLRSIIENSEGPFGVVKCICRKAHKMGGEPCKVTSRMETCMGFGEMAQFYKENGWGREVSKEEALEIIRKNEEEGLVLQAENILRPGFICSCCGCCCGVLTGLKEFPRPTMFFSTNFYADVDNEICTGCETCIDRCQMDAIKLVKEKAKVNVKRCIGCGLCVPSCPNEAISLLKKKETETPRDSRENLLYDILERKNQLRGKPTPQDILKPKHI